MISGGRTPLRIVATLCLLILAVGAHSGRAFAARAAIVDAPSVSVRAGPGPGFKVIETVSRGASVTASNSAIEGYYKVRTASGIIGFVPANALVFSPAAEATPPSEAVAGGPAPAKRRSSKAAAYRLRVLGNYDFFAVSDINTLFGADVLRFGYGVGAELGFAFTADLTAVLRVERLFKSVVAQDSHTGREFDMSLGSLPVLLGLDANLVSTSSFSVNASVFGGVAPLTRLSSTSKSESEPNVTEFSAMGIAAILKLDLIYQVNRSWSLFAEAGYRYLNTSQLAEPSLAGNGSTIFEDGGSYAPIQLNLGGLFAGAGVGVAF